MSGVAVISSRKLTFKKQAILTIFLIVLGALRGVQKVTQVKFVLSRE